MDTKKVEAAAAEPKLREVTVAVDSLNVRAAPQIDAALAGDPLPRGTVLSVGEEKDGWLELGDSGRWVKAEHVK